MECTAGLNGAALVLAYSQAHKMELNAGTALRLAAELEEQRGDLSHIEMVSNHRFAVRNTSGVMSIVIFTPPITGMNKTTLEKMLLDKTQDHWEATLSEHGFTLCRRERDTLLPNGEAFGEHLSPKQDSDRNEGASVLNKCVVQINNTRATKSLPPIRFDIDGILDKVTALNRKCHNDVGFTCGMCEDAGRLLVTVYVAEQPDIVQRKLNELHITYSRCQLERGKAKYNKWTQVELSIPPIQPIHQ